LTPEDFEGRPSFVQRHRLTTRVILALALGVAMAGLATCALVQRYYRGPARLEAAGVQAYVVENEERAPRRLGVVAARGDVVLVSDTLRVVIAGGEREDAPLGAVLEASLANGEGLTRGATLTPVVTDGARDYPVEFEAFRLVERGPEGRRLAMRLEGTATVGGAEVRVFLEYRLSDDRHALMIATHLASDDEVRLAAGLVVRWGGHAPLVPGHGLVVSSLVTTAPVIGADMRAADGITGAAVFAQGEQVVIQADTEQHGGSVELDQTLVSVVPQLLGPSAPQRQGFGLALSSYGLSDAVRRVGWLEGRHFPEASVVVPGAPTGTHVRLERRSGPVLLDAYVDARGVATLPLLGELAPGDAFVVRAEAYGYLPSPTREVVAGERVRLIIPKGGQVWVRLADLSGTPMPARIRILGRDGTATPALGPDYFASGAGEAVVTASGEAVIPLPPGNYRVIVSHGPEWSAAVSDIVVTEGTRPEVDARIEHVVPPRGWVACDFHVHQSPSDDSEVPIEDRVATLAAEGIGFAVPTDHNHVTDYGPAIETHGLTDFGTVVGVEVTTWDPNFGHFNAFPFPLNDTVPRNGAPAFVQRTPAELFAELHALGPDVLVQVNHPRLEPNIGYWDLTGFDAATGQATGGPGGTFDAGYDLVEVWNGYDLSRPTHVERVFQDWLALLETGVRVVGTGNSDSHLVRYYWAGYPRTYVYAPDGVSDPATVLAALRAGRVFVTSGPFLEVSVAGSLPGDRVVAQGGEVLVDVVVRAPAYIDVEELQVFVGRTLVTTLPIRHAAPVLEPGTVAPGVAPPIVRYQGQLRVPVDRDAPLVVRVRSDTSMDDFLGRRAVFPMAFTNPIFVDADGDGSLRWFPVVDAGVPLASRTDSGSVSPDDAASAAEDAGAAPASSDGAVTGDAQASEGGAGEL